MSRIVRKIANASPAKVWDALSNPTRFLDRLRFPPDADTLTALRALDFAVDPEEVKRLGLALLEHHALTAAFEQGMVRERRRRVRWAPWSEFMYVLVRLVRPATMIETGVFDGQSSAIILQAMADNAAAGHGEGRLISVDFPAVAEVEGSTDRMLESTLPPGHDPGWIIPDELRARHTLHLGDAKQLLPKLLVEHAPLDVFFHDSLHTYEHQMFEYTAAWPHLRDGGLMLSDDIFWSEAFYRFCRQHERRFVRVDGFGAARK